MHKTLSSVIDSGMVKRMFINFYESQREIHGTVNVVNTIFAPVCMKLVWHVRDHFIICVNRNRFYPYYELQKIFISNLLLVSENF